MIGGEQCLKSVSGEVQIGYLENIFTEKMVQHRKNFPREGSMALSLPVSVSEEFE